MFRLKIGPLGIKSFLGNGERDHGAAADHNGVEVGDASRDAQLHWPALISHARFGST